MSPATAAPAVLAAGIPSPAQGVWHLGPIPLRAYAFAILTGIVIATWIAVRRYRARGGPEGTILDSIFWAVPLGIVGARIYHVLSSPDAYFGPNGNPWNAFAIWNGGLGIWGAIPAGALGIWIYLRRRGLRLATVADAMAPGVLVAQAIGRLGNYFNQELFGEPTTLPWGLQIHADRLAELGMNYPPGTLFQPTFLYELLWDLAMAGLVILIDRKFRLGHGRVFWLYVFCYTVGRGWIETLRIDAAEHVLGLRLNVWTSILVCLVSLAIFLILTKKYPQRESSPWLPGREPTDEDSSDGESVDEDPVEEEAAEEKPAGETSVGEDSAAEDSADDAAEEESPPEDAEEHSAPEHSAPEHSVRDEGADEAPEHDPR